jgi:hypothetical protein
MSDDSSHEIASILAGVWDRHRSPSFLRYIAEAFGETVTEMAEFDRLYLVEAESGDADAGVIHTSVVRCWWAMDDQGLRRTRRPEDLPPDPDDPRHLRGPYYRVPLIRFYRAGETITFGEAYGPTLACRKVGRLHRSNLGIMITDVRLVWNFHTIADRA